MYQNMEACEQEYLEIDLQGQHVVSSVVVQGRYGNGLGQEYAEYYVMMYWREDTGTWVEYREGDNRLLQANNNTYQPVETRLRGNTVLTSKVRWELKYFLTLNPTGRGPTLLRSVAYCSLVLYGIRIVGFHVQVL